MRVPVDSVVDALVRRRLDPAVLPADLDHLGDLPGHVVADAEALELALLVELVHGPKGLLVRCGAVGAVQVPHLERAARGSAAYRGKNSACVLGLESFERVVELLAEVLHEGQQCAPNPDAVVAALTSGLCEMRSTPGADHLPD